MKLILQLICTGFYLQVTVCDPSCILAKQIAYCSFRPHRWVPVLPPNITHLYLDGNYISEINSTSLRGLEELQHLNLEEQHVTLIIRNDSFLRQKNLTELLLGSNLNLRLEPRAFAGLFSLQNLSLYHCSLTDSILSEGYLEPLLSLEELNLYGNQIGRLKPGLFFSNITKFTRLNLKLNLVQKMCEEDLVGFRGKYFAELNLASNQLLKSDVGECGNPFKGMAFNVLDLSGTGFNEELTKHFFRAIEGTTIGHLKYEGILGKGFSHNNSRDPDRSTFQGLKNSSVVILELSKNWIFALESDVFSALQDVMILDVSQNKINQIKRNAFGGLQDHLKMLNLSSNLLGEVFSYTFNSLTELLLLDLSYNHVGVLGYNAFSGLYKLQHLDLTGNSLRRLGFLAPLPSLNALLLRDNKLNVLGRGFRLGTNSIYLDVSENRLTNMEDIYVILTQFPHLQYLFYGSNLIKWCTINGDVGIPHNNSLETLDLHDSSLQIVWGQGTCLDVFDHLQNLLDLNISLNSLMALPQGIFRGLSSVVQIDLSSNALTYLQRDILPPSLKILHLSNNFLVSPDPVAFQSLSFLSLANNRFLCDCTLEGFLMWLNSTNVTFLSPVQEYRCEFPAAVHNLPLLDYLVSFEPCEEDDEKAVQVLRFALFIVSAVLVLGVTLSGLVYARLRGHLFIIYKKIVNRVLVGSKATPDENNLQYDVFLCFSNSDYRWVEAALLKKLDSQFSEENFFRCCFEARDFLPGEDHLSNIRDAIWDSRKTLCIVSKEFLKDGWCLEAFTLAQGRMLEELTNVLVMVVVGKVTPYQLMRCSAIRTFVQKRWYLTWPEDPQDLEWFYERLIVQILKDTKVKEFAVGNPKAVQPEPEPREEIRLENVQEMAF
ncbi:toll-like receptor 5 isoform X2 [Kryptolebias marmoratus]|uniref:Toll like receptor 5 n=2 Tax=Kryptolebias marmoratus TaxID=37003 RepID=A0A3Q3B9Q0_KRYMA|nr:toll-like receptor 5 isoform X2 [Kryptolebias marmoratus]